VEDDHGSKTTRRSSHSRSVLCAGLGLLGYFIAEGVVSFRALDRTVMAKGLAEREVAADVAIWPIRFDLADGDLSVLTAEIEKKSGLVLEFLRANGFGDDEITVGTPAVVDRKAQRYGGNEQDGFRYQGSSTITVYSGNIEGVRTAMTRLVDLGKKGSWWEAETMTPGPSSCLRA